MPVQPTPGPSQSRTVSPNPSTTSTGWEPLDVDGKVSALGGDYVVVAAGTDGAGPWVRYLGPEGGRLLDRSFLTGVDSPDAVVEYARYVAVVDLEGGDIARTAGALVWSDGLSEPADLDAPEDGGGRSPTWLSVEFDDEEALHATGLVPGRSPAEAWRLEAWTDTGRWRPLSATPTVYAAPGTVPVADATMNGVVVVAGRLAAERPTPGTRPPLALWSGPNVYARSKRWARLPLRPLPDSITDLRCEDPACWVAGVRDGRAVVLDEVQLRGRRVPTPSVNVPTDSKVLIASAAAPRGLILAVETRRGNEVWIRDPSRNERESDWRRLAAPEGEIEAARSFRGDIYLLVNGKLWHGQLDRLPPAR
jgi:hypothetical protein